MSPTIAHSASTARWRLPALAVAAAVLSLSAGIVAVGADSADGADAKRLGTTKRTPKPSCPRDSAQNPCQATGSVTGFQIKAGGRDRLFRMPENGKVVAWGLRMSRPNKSQRTFFGRFFKHSRLGSRPTARLAVLNRVGKTRYKLTKQTPVARLARLLGEQPIFTLRKALTVRKGRILALTVPTWVPNFATGLSRERNAWRASRGSGKCTKRADIKAGKPQQKVGSTRRYGCRYGTARLLYWAYYVPDRR
jgi:hypothetical protein